MTVTVVCSVPLSDFQSKPSEAVGTRGTETVLTEYVYVLIKSGCWYLAVEV